MPRIIQQRRGSTSAVAAILGAAGELFVDTSLVTVVVMDGVTTGGTTLARNADLTAINSSVNTVSSNLNTVSSNLNTVSSNILAAHTFNTTQTFAGSNTSVALKLFNAVENITVTSSAAGGSINFDLTTNAFLYYTGTSTGNWSLNFRGNSSASLNSLLQTGNSISAALAVTNLASYSATTITIDSTTSNVVLKYNNSSSVGNTTAVDIHSYTIIKTAESSFTVLVSLTKFV